jgi:hypothetical protein
MMAGKFELALRNFKSFCNSSGRGKLEIVHVHYVPATIRAALTRIGAPVTIELEGESIDLPAQVLPGEVEWRADLLKWLVRKCVSDYIATPVQQRDEFDNTIELQLIVHTGLHPLEARIVLQEAYALLGGLTADEYEAMTNGNPLFKGHVRTEWDGLKARYAKILRGSAESSRRSLAT